VTPHHEHGPQPNWSFKLMALTYKFRDARLSRQAFLNETGIKPGDTVLDYGCGPGSYVSRVARMIGESGQLYALDRHPMALRMASEAARRAHLSNVTTILSDRDTGLPANSVDVVLLYDIYHDLLEPHFVLQELYRVLKPSGVLSSHDHHFKGNALREAIVASDLFTLRQQGLHTVTFSPVGDPP